MQSKACIHACHEASRCFIVSQASNNAAEIHGHHRIVDPELRDALALWPVEPLTANSLTQRRASLLELMGTITKPDLADIVADKSMWRVRLAQRRSAF